MSAYIRPAAAFKKLETARTTGQNVYIYGATGYGKTELIRQFLKNSKYIYIPCERIGCDLSQVPENNKRIATIVIDNINIIESEEQRQKIKELCSRRNLWVLLIGRSRMPGWLYDTFISCHMLLITEDDLAMSLEGIDSYMRSEGIILTEEELEFQRKCSEGNPLGVIFTAQQLQAGKKIGKELFRENSFLFQTRLEKGIITELDSEISDFLMKISILEDFTEALAAIISGNSAINSLIVRILDSGNYLDYKDGIYTIRFQMREALRRKAEKELSEKDIRHLALLAGGYYESRNEDDKALKLYAEYGETERIRDLLIKNSRKNPESGYFIEMRKYYLMLSDEEIRSNIYLMSAMSMLCSMLMDFEKSEYWYNELKKYKNTVKGSKQREAISLLAYLDVALPGRGSVNILQLIKDCYILLSEKSISVPEFSVTSNLPSLMNGGKDFCEWSKHDREIAATAGNIVCAFLGKYGKGLVNAALAESFYEKGGDPYEIISLISKARLEAESGGKTELRFAATATLIRQYISNGDIVGAKELLCSFEKVVRKEGLHKLFPNIEAMKCRLALYSNDMGMVKEWMKVAPDENSEFVALERYRYLTKVRCYIAFEQYDKAYALIEALKYYSEKFDRKYLIMELGVLTAMIMYKRGFEWEKEFILTLEKACEYRFVPIIAKEGATVYEMLKECSDKCSTNKKINKEWFKRITEEAGKITRLYPLYLKSSAEKQVMLHPMDEKILTCLADGLSIGDTAERLGINYETLRSRIKELYRKLGAKNKTEAVMIASSLKLI